MKYKNSPKSLFLLLIPLILLYQNTTIAGCNWSAVSSHVKKHKKGVVGAINKRKSLIDGKIKEVYKGITYHLNDQQSILDTMFIELNNEKTRLLNLQNKKVNSIKEDIDTLTKRIVSRKAQTSCNTCFEKNLNGEGKLNCLLSDFKKYKNNEYRWNYHCKTLVLSTLRKELQTKIETSNGNEAINFQSTLNDIELNFMERINIE